MFENQEQSLKKLNPKNGFAAIFLSAFFIVVFSFFKTENVSPLIFEVSCVFLPALIVLILSGKMKSFFSAFFPEKKEIIFSSLFFIPAFVFGFSFANLIDKIFDISEITEELNKTILPYNFFLQILLFAVSPALFEEILFRGVILNSFLKYGKIFSLLLTSILFTIFHGSYQLFIPIFIMSFFLSVTGLLRGGLLLAITFHFVFNLFNLIAMNFIKGEITLALSLVMAILSFPFYFYFSAKGVKNV